MKLNYAEWIYVCTERHMLGVYDLADDNVVCLVGYGNLDETPSTSTMLIFA